MQHGTDTTTNIEPLQVKTALEQPFGQLTMTDAIHLDQHFLGLAHTLQSTLDIRKLLELYDDEVSAFIPHDGFSFQHPAENIHIEFGVIDHHSYSYKLVLLNKPLGEIVFYRKTPFDKDEIDQLDRLVAALLYPVRNSLLYKRAVETAFHDPLTDLNNRAAMDSSLDQELDFASRHNLPLAILMLDIDKFKSVNDTFGHIAGDKILKHVADKLRESVRRSDVIFRYGGEEFLILLRNTELAGARIIADRIRESVEQTTCEHDQHRIQVTVSIGLASHAPGENKYALLQRADAALYKAKESGRNQVLVAD